jgi:hypothetical protein
MDENFQCHGGDLCPLRVVGWSGSAINGVWRYVLEIPWFLGNAGRG